MTFYDRLLDSISEFIRLHLRRPACSATTVHTQWFWSRPHLSLNTFCTPPPDETLARMASTLADIPDNAYAPKFAPFFGMVSAFHWCRTVD